MKYLVIVESPSKCKKIEKILNDKSDFHIYEVVATMGHITELKSLQSIDVCNHFKCHYDLIKAKLKNTESIRKKIKKVDEVILCCDPDREGEGIAAAICSTFDLDIYKTKRVTFNEITESAILHAFQHPRTVDLHLVHAQQTRQILDLLVGYKVSPMLWNHITKRAASSLSAGRCQTPALQIIYDNQREREKEEPNQNKVYNTTGYFTTMNLSFELNKTFKTEQEVVGFLKDSTSFSHSYSCTNPVAVYKPPPEPFTTSRLQQTASNELHFSPKETMQLCQTLYEAGYITYMRTDSKKYSKEFIEKVKSHIVSNYGEGEKYIYENIHTLINEEQEPQTQEEKQDQEEKQPKKEAHEAIRPTNISLYDLPPEVNSREKRMYKLIWTNALESCMASAFFSAITATIAAGGDNAVFRRTCEQVCFPGWLIVTTTRLDKAITASKEYSYLRAIQTGERCPYKKICVKMVLKGIKPHFTEARLIQVLEEKGIGRPSTFAGLVEKIQERGYVKKTDVSGKKIICKDYELEDGNIVAKEEEREFGNEKNKLVIQPLGKIVMDFLEKHFSSLFNYDYTREMEEALDKIAKGEEDWEKLCTTCNRQLDDLIEPLNKEKKMEIHIDETHSYIVGKYGPVIKQVETKADGKEVIQFKPVKKDIDVHQIERGELGLEELVDTDAKKKQFVIGQYDGEDVVLKKGRYGIYATWGENSKPLKEFGNRPLENIAFEEVKPYLEEGATNSVLRKLDETLSIRKGKGTKPDYLFYKTPKMKKPQFYDLAKFSKETNQNYKTCGVAVVKEWVKTQN